jgi:LAS superfamily LD-carboxypeptidase LdcB
MMPVLLVVLAIAVVAGVILIPKTALAYQNGKQLGPIELKPIGSGFYLRSDAAEQFNLMRQDASTDGVSLVVDSAFRSMAEQEALYAELVAGSRTTPVAKPGYSNHQNGIAVDIAVQSSQQSPTYQWLAANAGDYGFVNTGATFNNPEYWHWEYHS